METKRFPPTARRLEQARNDGHAPISQVATNTATLLAVGATLLYFLPQHLSRLQALMTTACATQSPQVSDILVQFENAGALFRDLVVAPWLVGCAAAIAVSLVQAGNVRIFHPIRPSWKWTSPFNPAHIQRSFTFSFLALIAIVAAAIFISTLAPYTPWGSEMAQDISAISHWLYAVLHYPIGGLLVFAGVDILWQRHQFRSSLWMTLEEMHDEERSQTLPKPVRLRIEQERHASREPDDNKGGHTHRPPPK